MKEFIKKHSKVYMILSVCLLIGTIGVTYAYYAASVTNDKEVVGTAGGGSSPLMTISLISTEADDSLIPVDMDIDTLSKAASASPKCVDNNGYSACQIYSVTIQNNSDVSQSYNINLSRLYGANTPNVDAVTMGTSSSSVSDASSIKENGLICTTNSVGKGDTTNACYFMVLIKNIYSAQTDSGTFNGTISATSSTGSKIKADFSTGDKAVTVIKNLYNSASKTTVTNNGITYNYAQSVNLMNDRLGTMGVGIDSGNIRYYGANPNNYIDIGDKYEQDTVVNHYEENAWILNTLGITSQNACLTDDICTTLISAGKYTDEASCQTGLTTMFGTYEVDGICGTETIPAGTTKALYRIIGLFKNVELADGSRKDLIKVMRNDPIGLYRWDKSDGTINGGNGVNEWSQAELMKLLNPGYEDETVGGSLYWNSSSGTCYSSSYTTSLCDFTNKGITANVQGNIEEVKWNLGGAMAAGLYVNKLYQSERGYDVVIPGTTCSGTWCNDGITRTTEWPGKVALAYPSDYGYAVDLSTCSGIMNGYNNCIGTNWIYPRMTFVGVIDSWLLTPALSSPYNAWGVMSDGVVGHYNTFVFYGVNPVFYLDSELVIESGSGTNIDPYVIW